MVFADPLEGLPETRIVARLLIVEDEQIIAADLPQSIQPCRMKLSEWQSREGAEINMADRLEL